MKEKLRSVCLILLAGAASFAIFGTWLLLVTVLAQYFKTHGAFEAHVLADSFLKPIALVFLAAWVLLAGVFLKRKRIIKWGRRMLYAYLAISIGPYILSFGVKPS